MNLDEAIAVFDKSAERTRPNKQTEAWTVIRAAIALMRGQSEQCDATVEDAGYPSNPHSPVQPKGCCRQPLLRAAPKNVRAPPHRRTQPMSSEMSEFLEQIGHEAGVARVAHKRGAGAYVEGVADTLANMHERLSAILARTEAGADGAGVPFCPNCGSCDVVTHPQDASGDADIREFTRDDLPPATHTTFIAPRGSVWCWVGHEVIEIVNKHVAAMQAKEAK